MATAGSKITLSSSRDIPLNKLILSQSNVRRVKAGVSIEELAEDIARRGGPLQSLNVRPVLEADGAETGMFEVPAGGRRLKALQLLVKQKRLAKTAPIPCVVRDPATEILAEDDLLAENVQRAPLHPLDQFRAFQALREKGQSEEDIAAAFFVGVNVVKQRLRLAAVSEMLLEVYAEDGMSLEQLMAFTVTTDHARQEQVWDALAALLQPGALPDPPHADRAHRPRVRQARAVRRARLPTSRQAASSCAISSKRTMAAGSRTSHSSTAWSPTSSRPRRRRSPPKAGSGSR